MRKEKQGESNQHKEKKKTYFNKTLNIDNDYIDTCNEDLNIATLLKIKSGNLKLTLNYNQLFFCKAHYGEGEEGDFDFHYLSSDTL